MATIDLGNKPLEVGQNRQLYDPFSVRDSRAYLVYSEMVTSNPNNIFSFVRIGLFFAPDQGDGFYLPQTYDLEIRESIQSFFVPLSTLYGQNGTISVSAQRLSKVRGGADSDSALTMRLFYDDKASIRTWL